MLKSKSGILFLVVTLTLLGYHSLMQVKRVSAAYVYGYPLLLMDRTRDALLAGSADSNRFTHSDQFPDHTFRNVVRLNNDTLYSIAWLDLAAGPQVLSVPDTDGRYYVMPLMDAWTNVFAMVGKRTTGSAAGAYLIAGPDWQGEAPEGVSRIDAPTNMIWVIGRIQTNGKQDIPAVVSLQQKFTLASLDQWSQGESRPAIRLVTEEKDTSLDPSRQVENMHAEQFLSALAKLMGEQYPAPADQPTLEALASIGVIPGQIYSGGLLGPLDDYLANLALDITRSKIKERLAAARGLENGWSVVRDSIGEYGTDYTVRAGVAMVGLGALPPAEASYPNTSVDAMGRSLGGEHRYRLHFGPGQTPPADAFWSLTMYDEEGFLIDNPIRRYAIGDRDNLRFNADGSLDLYIQQQSPQGQESNWLPAPAGAFALTMRIYSPGTGFLDGSWKLPGVQRE